MHRKILQDLTVLLFFILDYNDARPEKGCKIPNANSGKCSTLKECEPMYTLDKKMPKTTEEDTFLRQSVGSCSGRGIQIMVCCPSKSQWDDLVVSPITYPEPSISFTQSNEILGPVHNRSDTSMHDPLPPPLTINEPVETTAEKLHRWNTFLSQKNWDECGVDRTSTSKITGGTETEIDEYPWLALLEFEPNQFKCGGSLISRSHILTAAHCLYNPPKQVRLSEYNLTTEPTDVVDVSGGGKDYITVTIVGIKLTTQHPDHKFESSINDIGLIEMNKTVKFEEYIRPICLPTVDYRNTDFNASTRFSVAGWGSDELVNNEFLNSEVKRSVLVPYVPIDKCSDMLSLNSDKLPPEQLICAGGEEGKDSCRGDSGGPLMYKYSPDSYVVVGIVSSGPTKCGSKNRPGIYTYVYHYIDWIKTTMGDVAN